MDQDTRTKVVEMYLAGQKTAAITEETGVPRSTIYWILQQQGVQPQRLGKRAPAASEQARETLEWCMTRILDQERQIATLRAVERNQAAAIRTLMRLARELHGEGLEIVVPPLDPDELTE